MDQRLNFGFKMFLLAFSGVVGLIAKLAGASEMMTIAIAGGAALAIAIPMEMWLRRHGKAEKTS